jgi:hypothetical protein
MSWFPDREIEMVPYYVTPQLPGRKPGVPASLATTTRSVTERPSPANFPMKSISTGQPSSAARRPISGVSKPLQTAGEIGYSRLILPLWGGARVEMLLGAVVDTNWLLA